MDTRDTELRIVDVKVAKESHARQIKVILYIDNRKFGRVNMSIGIRRIADKNI